MKPHKNEAQLLKFALEIGVGYAKKRGFDEFDRGVSPKDKVECIYGPNMKHKLILWISRQLPADHPLLK